MGCGCKKHKPRLNMVDISDPIVLVSCTNCPDPLLGIDGIYYPLNVIGVAVPMSYVEHWKQITNYVFNVTIQ